MKGIQHVARLRGLDYYGYKCICKVLRLTKPLALRLSRPVTVFYVDIIYTPSRNSVTMFYSDFRRFDDFHVFQARKVNKTHIIHPHIHRVSQRGCS